VMGQYDTYTPLQLSQYITTLANGKERLQPHFLKEVHEKTKNNDLGKVIYAPLKKVLNKIDVDDIYINRVKEGFYAVTHANYGIGHNYIDNKYDGAGKTGTSQSFIDTNNDGVIDKETITTAFVGYAPKDNPKISIVVVSPSINNPHGYSESVSQVTKRISYQVTESYFSKHS
ncbi:MAG: penicillin-binding transpeptidase domain-containing protein, partial [Bacilli bacterium]